MRAMQPGERIAIKAAYVRKNGLPFDNRGHGVAAMASRSWAVAQVPSVQRPDVRC
ncbi:hypothetical protein [Thauera sp. WH-1]|uniref:hypothetical protein n=1 Tax=Thauera sp. WH-1 TaxID=3398230 RepID=UPI0039FCB005